MSNKTQLQTNNTALDGYIARINAVKEVAAGLPEAGGSGGSGGGSVETTTVTINSTANRVYLTVYENGEITAKTGLVGILGNTLTNVVRGSIMVVRSQSGAVSVQNATQINALTFTTESGEEERFVAFSVN